MDTKHKTQNEPDLIKGKNKINSIHIQEHIYSRLIKFGCQIYNLFYFSEEFLEIITSTKLGWVCIKREMQISVIVIIIREILFSEIVVSLILANNIISFLVLSSKRIVIGQINKWCTSIFKMNDTIVYIFFIQFKHTTFIIYQS